MELNFLGKSNPSNNLETKRPEVSHLSDDEISDLKSKWEERNFMDMNIWCQNTKCKLDIEVTELEAQKKFLTRITVLDDQRQLSEDIFGEGIGSNKKESKTNAMRTLMNKLIETGDISIGLKKGTSSNKEQRYDDRENSSRVRSRDNSKEHIRDNSKDSKHNQSTYVNGTTFNETISSKDKLDAIKRSNDTVEKKVSKAFKLMLVDLKDQLFDDAMDCLKYITRSKKILDWLDVSHVLIAFLETKNLDLVFSFIDYLKSENIFDEEIPIDDGYIVSNDVNTQQNNPIALGLFDIFKSLDSSYNKCDNFEILQENLNQLYKCFSNAYEGKTEENIRQTEGSSEIGALILDEIYNLLLFTGDYSKL
jgi:hypothetical protein